MREILYRNITGIDHRRHEQSIREIIVRGDVIAKVERRCVYFVRDKIYIDDPGDVDRLEALKKDDARWKKRRFHILRDRDSALGGDKLFCKAAGNFYIIAGRYVFSIIFIHSVKIDLETVSTKGGGAY